ncbi:lysophospholipid acyltransferase family protein [Tunturiibacter empetritectus]|uniref:1-acyl-sn-glycerol-3-phosphate acyltransferase n=1 Tax=Tunturiibacter lichenicola TaxID=2051959 RepID=A0A852VEH4_9BACT|nr:1-acyl-sn-glycerol-3-phosphate acyltransferase [Edaphobacter lichenicola]
MNFFRAAWRSVWMVGMFVRFGAELALTRPSTRKARAAWLHRFCASAMRGLGIEISVAGSFPERGAVISNHLSYLDIVVFAAVHPCVFVSKAEIKKWPVVGWMTTMSGTVYVERGHGGSAMRARAGMQAAVDAGLPVVFFPEGTTSNGSGLLKFHSGLLAQAIDGGAPVTAACLRYELGEDNGPGVSVADDVCYWGDRNMLGHVFTFLGLHGVSAKVRFAERPMEFSSDALHRKQAAVEARAAVAALRTNTFGEGEQVAGEMHHF